MKISKTKKKLVFGICILIFILLGIFCVKNVFSMKEDVSIKEEDVAERISNKKTQKDKSIEYVEQKSKDGKKEKDTSEKVVKNKKNDKATKEKSSSEMPEKEVPDEISEEEVFKDTEQEINDTLPILKVNNVKAKPGEKNVEMVVSVENNPGILGMSFAINYDENAVKLVEVKSGTVAEGILTFTHSKELSTGCKCIWDGTEISSAQIKDGDVLLLSFDVMDDAKEGEYSVDISYGDGDIVDHRLIPIDMNIKNGKIYIKK